MWRASRDHAHPCAGSLGDACAFSCEAGYRAIGRHVCQTYTAGGQTFIDAAFFGGRCERLCSAAPACSHGEAVVRFNSSDARGPCLAARCFEAQIDATRSFAIEPRGTTRDDATCALHTRALDWALRPRAPVWACVAPPPAAAAVGTRDGALAAVAVVALLAVVAVAARAPANPSAPSNAAARTRGAEQRRRVAPPRTRASDRRRSEQKGVVEEAKKAYRDGMDERVRGILASTRARRARRAG